MKGKIVGHINETEKNEIVLLVERLYALKELKSGNNNLFMNESELVELHSKIEKREEQTKLLLSKWWEKEYNKYQWEKEENHVWKIDYENGNVLLIENLSC